MNKEYKDISGMTRAEKEAYFTARRGTGRGKLITLKVSPSLFDEIEARKGKRSRAALVRQLLYEGLAERKRLELLQIRPGSKQHKERQEFLDRSAQSYAALRNRNPADIHKYPAAAILGKADD